MPQITHDNHYVPQLYLKYWSEDKSRIWAYRILVPHQNVKKWEHRAIRGVAYHRDLYTVIRNGQEVDDFEKWLEVDFETPVQEVINKVIKEKHLKNIDWVKLARFLAAQDVRTPTSYLEMVQRWESILPDALDKALEKGAKKLENIILKQEIVEAENVSNNLLKNIINVQVKQNPNREEGGSIIEANIVAGRALWIENQKLLLRETSNVLLNHKWSIVKPAKGFEWFTSDHPVVRLNYYKEDSYDLKGGWGNTKGNIFMPLSPYHLLFTQVGSDLADQIILSPEKTREIQKIIAERSFRWIFAKQPISVVEKYRPRHIDSELFKTEEEQLRRWHFEQSSAETSQ